MERKLPEAEHLRVEEVADYLCIHPVTIRQWMKNGTLQGAKIGRRWFIVRSSLLDLFDRTKDAAKES